MFEWYLKVLKQYADFKGRARRSEYWYFALVNAIISFVLGIVDSAIGSETGFIGGIYSLFVLVPSLAVAVRRLHDTNRSGWWMLIALTGIGIFVLLYWYILEGDQGRNEYGADPKGLGSEVDIEDHLVS